MGRGVWKILVREIRQNPGRFLSIFFIVVLGTAFLSGVRACEPDMRQSMNQKNIRLSRLQQRLDRKSVV